MFFAVVALLAGAIAAPLSASAAPQSLEGLVNIRFQLDARAFAVMAAAAASELEPDRADETGNPVRAAVRERLARLEPELRSRLREFFGIRGATDPSSWVSLSLFLAGPPGFALGSPVESLPPEVQPMAGFERLVAEVWNAAALGEVWDSLRPEYARFVEGYRGPIRSMILRVLRYMRMEPRVALDRQVTFIPDLLNGAGVVNARNIAENYVVWVGPERSGRRPVTSLRHEYLHFMIDPLATKHQQQLPEPEPFLEAVRSRKRPRPGFDRDFPLVVAESLVRALELRLDRVTGPEETRAIADGFEEGLILLPHLVGELKRFETGIGSLREEFPELARGIRWEIERHRPAAVTRMVAELEAAGATAERDRNDAAARREKLVRANGLLQAGEFEAAGLALAEVLRDDPDNPSALLGLGQVAARAERLDEALEFYRRAAEEAGAEPWIAAWARVRRGGVLRFQGDTAGARAEWTRVIELTGDLRGAREAAAKALADAPAVRPEEP